MTRDLTAQETAAMHHFHARYAAQDGGAIEFWLSLSAAEQDFIRRMVEAIMVATREEAR